jgi:hypothetical protein
MYAESEDVPGIGAHGLEKTIAVEEAQVKR